MSRFSILPILLAGISFGPLAASQQETGVRTAAGDPIAEARAGLAAAEAAHPGNSPEVVKALLLLVQRQCVGRRIGRETHQSAQRALAMSEAAGGKESTLYASALAETAKLDLAENHAEKGRPRAEEALDIVRRTAPGTLDLAQIADALDKVCLDLGDIPCALSAAEQAVTAVRASHAKNELYLASMLQDLAQLRWKTGDRTGARAGVMESIEIVDRQKKPAPSMAVLESNAGAFFSMVSETDQALIHLNKALALSSSIYGDDSVQAAHAESFLAYTYARGGRNQEAIEQYDRALTIYRRWYGPVHNRTAGMEAEYAKMLAANGNLAQALELGIHSHQSKREYFSLAARVLPERQALALAKDENVGLNIGLSIVLKHPQFGVAAVYQEEIRSRALVAEEMAHRQVGLNRKNDPVIASLLDELDKERAAALASTSGAESGANSADYHDATMRMEKTERALAERSLAFRTDQRTRTVSLMDVRDHLPAQSVMVSYVAYNQYAAELSRFPSITPLSYLVFVLHPDSDRIRAIDLGPAKPIDGLIQRCRAAAEAEAHSGGLGSKRNERAYREAGTELRKKVWDPLQAEIGSAKLVLVVPDGELNLIPFSGLPLGKGYLVEHGPVIHLLTSERDLLPEEPGPRKNGLLAIGSPSFDVADNSLPASPLRDSPISCDQFRNLAFHPLPGSDAEVADIDSTWRRWNHDEMSSLITGADATRSRFLAEASRYRVLHVATHAFVLDKSCGNGNPLLHSGLVFAGANQGYASSILTAQQIASMDLGGVDWAVLSACNTGNGELEDGEGVLGLERAFRVAGAHSVVMALWPVDDEVTRRFMHELYSQRLGKRASTADSVWNASRNVLEERRAEGKSTHPWYWAGLVGSGGWN